MMPPRARSARPETPSECREFERVRNGYERNGLCHACAVQGSYGHQHGFSVVRPPCSACLPIVLTFEHPEPNGWRRASKARLRSPAVWAAESVGADGPNTPAAHISRTAVAS